MADAKYTINEHFVYMYLDIENIPFYIGKGKNRRYKISRHKRTTNKLLKNKILKVGETKIKIVFLNKNLSEIEAAKWEIYWIKFIGRRDKNLGTLCNLTDGGEGSSGYKMSEGNRVKHSQRMLGNTYGTNLKGHKNALGFHHTEEFKEKLSNLMKNNQNAKGSKGANLGKKLSLETRKKISKTRKDKGIGLGNKHALGRKHSLESKEKMRLAHQRRLKNKDNKNGN